MLRCDGQSNIAGLHAAVLNKWMQHNFASDGRGIVRDMPTLLSRRPFLGGSMSCASASKPHRVVSAVAREQRVSHSFRVSGYVSEATLKWFVKDVARRHAQRHSLSDGEEVLKVKLCPCEDTVQLAKGVQDEACGANGELAVRIRGEKVMASFLK